MDRIFIRNYLLFAAILFTMAIVLVYGLTSSEAEFDEKGDWVLHTHSVISQAKDVSRLTESMLASQRGFVLTGDTRFLEDYKTKKNDADMRIAALKVLTQDNQAQQIRVNEIQNYFEDFSKDLENRSELFLKNKDQAINLDVQSIDALRGNIIRINNDMLEEQYALLDGRISRIEQKKGQYFSSLIVGVISAVAILLLLNWFLFTAQRKRSSAEETLRDSQGRFKLVVEGTQDGVFDWNLKDDSVYYSKQFFNMLGYDRPAITSTVDEFENLLHPEDKEQVWDHVNDYLNDQLSEYSQKFRMKHHSGRWVWIQSRAQSLLDKKGKAYRIVGAHTDITSLMSEQLQLEEDKERAEEANRAKSDFLAHMSHEIRTPLTAISGISEIFVNNDDNLNEKQKMLVSTLHSSTSALKDLISDILDFSKIESGELDLDERNFGLCYLFEEVISMMSLKASEKGISFVFDYNDLKDTAFYGDKSRMRQILINIVGNAIKFTDEGAVTVAAHIEDREGDLFLRVDVSDTGVGIAPENFDLVFERFKQADESVSRKYGGTGLGLPISKNLASLMGGDIFLSSEKGDGSTFSILLPCKVIEDNAVVGRQQVNNSKINDRLQQVLRDETKVLLVEDYEGNIVVISYILDDVGLEYDIARNGEEATKLWADNHYDLILMDVQMPKMDGFAATKFIRDHEKSNDYSHTPIIGMTAHALVGDKDKCIAAGMDSYLPKPIVDEDLKGEILKYINQKKDAA